MGVFINYTKKKAMCVRYLIEENQIFRMGICVDFDFGIQFKKKSKLTKSRNIVYDFEAKWSHPQSSCGYDFSICFSSNLNHS